MKRLVVLGSGESGVGTALLAVQKGWTVFVSDKGSISQEHKKELNDAGVEFEDNKHTEEKILAADEIMKSPGIPDTAPLVVKARAKGIPVVSEIEFAGRYMDAKSICITGSNGKTTTTLLIYELLKNAGLNVELAGNVGTSLARQIAEGKKPEWFVIELSSFQLDGMFDFKADIAVLLNITPDHLDRYEYSMQKYIESKFRILQNQTEQDYFIYCEDDENIRNELGNHIYKSNLIPFTQRDLLKSGAYVTNDEVIINYNQDTMSILSQELSLQGKHNLYNSMAAGIVASVLKIKKTFIRESLTTFKGVEHRLEKVCSVRGIEFINDSKATNVNSTWYALECMNKSVVWIAGGVDKGNDYEDLMPLAKSKVKALICLGINNTKLIESFQDVIPTIKESKSMKEAVELAYHLGKKGDIVLLSPACASFDLFNSYIDRGIQFKECVREL
ncbi:UDP-N-acetylmuramoyl-L-alanine--D-glutamate ligase [Carboxylicivirga caseinilyticus]|uniref:UDP-N-acetylmuramoyl-L-alanine--D-glutamate ligase n=1 Tax=Carboxylicivirga caseinilyticus TaxID=3417572 RepID=UPI003D3599C8|nr:UDP-N-acetylmuramoyl-L-alanine--D-glutamate ligase [Marinilabiliaceae bacterium A049]